MELKNNEEDIVKAIIRETRGEKKEEIKVVSIRPNQSGNQNAMVSLNKHIARDLIKTENIKIG